MKPKLTLAEIREYLDCDPETGQITWKVHRNSHARKVAPGVEAGWEHNAGYRCVTLMQRDMLAHRLVWLFAHGAWPDGHIDHVNGQKQDNRIANLRQVSQALNCQNHHGMRANNTSGVKGVHWDTRRQRWVVQISVAKKHLLIGRFVDKDEARKAAEAARAKYHPHAHEVGMIAAVAATET